METFWNKVEFGPNCWEWKAGKSKGYGVFKGKHAHRVAYEMVVGPLGKLHGCHSCDNPGCVRPSHIFAGTPKDNAQDRVRKGRSAGPRSPSREKILWVRDRWAEGWSLTEIGRESGIGYGTVKLIVEGRRFRSVV